MVNIPYHVARNQGKLIRSFYKSVLPQIAKIPISQTQRVPITVYALSCERDIPEQVASLRSLGKLAREAWEKWFSPDVIYIRMLNYIESIYLERDSNHDEKKYQEEWLSWKFQWERGWTPLQRATRVLRRQISKISISKEKQ